MNIQKSVLVRRMSAFLNFSAQQLKSHSGTECRAYLELESHKHTCVPRLMTGCYQYNQPQAAAIHHLPQHSCQLLSLSPCLKLVLSHYHQPWLLICVCVCSCVREGNKDKEERSAWVGAYICHTLHWFPSNKSCLARCLLEEDQRG